MKCRATSGAKTYDHDVITHPDPLLGSLASIDRINIRKVVSSCHLVGVFITHLYCHELLLIIITWRGCSLLIIITVIIVIALDCCDMQACQIKSKI